MTFPGISLLLYLSLLFCMLKTLILTANIYSTHTVPIILLHSQLDAGRPALLLFLWGTEGARRQRPRQITKRHVLSR